MTNSELDSILKKARLPEFPETDSELLSRQLVARIRRNERASRPSRSALPRWGWALAAATCVVIAFAIGHWHGRVDSRPGLGKDSLANLKLIRETLALFPNRVRAIVQDKNGLKLVLSENNDVPVSAPLYVRICDGSQCLSFVTFSGQEVQVDGQKIDVLVDAKGGIILEGNKFVWSNTEKSYAGKRLKIEARNLGLVRM
ncbi:MAG: hypothetical protein WCS94_02375 [Verrucomicrobiota bacterium]